MGQVRRWSNGMRDQVGHPSLAMVNKTTGQSIHHVIVEC
jgi:hypothetical protein